MSRKRAHEESFPEDLLTIRLADTTPLAADRIIISSFSSCVRGLPADADSWDLSQLVVEGQAVQRETVVAWLNAAYSIIQDEAYEKQEQDPAANIAGFVQLLAFADAVGSSKRMLRELYSNVKLQCAVQLGDKQIVLPLVWYRYLWYNNGTKTSLMSIMLRSGQRALVGVPADSQQQLAVAQQVARQLEALLFLTHQLQLQHLQTMVLGAIRENTAGPDSLLHAAADLLATERVLAVTGMSKAAVLADGLLMQPLTFTGQTQVLKLLGASPGKVVVSADPIQDFLHFKQGDSLMIQLDIAAGKVSIRDSSGTWIEYPMQLLLGTPCAGGGPAGQQ